MATIATAAVSKMFPGADVKRVTVEREGITLYEVMVIKNGAEAEIEVAADGTVAEAERAVMKADLPAAVSAALARAAGDAKVKELERSEVHAELRLVTLAKPRVGYEAEFVRNGKTVDVAIDESGKVLSQEVDDDGDDD